MQILRAIVLGLILLGMGVIVTRAGYGTLREWRAIGIGYALCGLVWAVAGAAMLVGGAWTLGSLGRHRIPLWGAGGAAIVAGTVLIAGVLTGVVPCSGPS